jgi:hypothetical protein
LQARSRGELGYIMHRLGILRPALLLIALIGAIAAANRESVSPTQASLVNCSQWMVIPSPNVNAFGSLGGVAGDSPGDLWAVGNYTDPSSGLARSLTEHWNGSAWGVIASPNVSSVDNALSAVAVLASSDAWAVGSSGFAVSGSLQTLIEHWNGTSWKIVSSPSPGPLNFLTSVTAISATNVWASGVTGTDSTSDEQTLIEHWNGSAWSVVTSPNRLLPTNYLTGVSAVSANDIWAVGRSEFDKSLTEHWNGTSWSIVASPNVGSVDNILWSVAAVATNNVWAVGETDSGGNPQLLVEHWNGANWAVVTSANFGPQGSQLYGVAARASAGQPWAVGYLFLSVGYAPLTEIWNGAMWAYVRAPAQPPYSGLNAVTVIPHPGTPKGVDVWAVGNASDGTPQGRHALILRSQPFTLGIACQNP